MGGMFLYISLTLHRPYIWQVPPNWVPGMAIDRIDRLMDR